MSDQGLFSILSLIILGSGFCVIKMKNQVVSAINLILNLFAIACLFAFTGAHFVAAIQVLLYAGAIMVLFLFVIMLLSLKPDELRGPRLSGPDLGVLALAIIAFGFMATMLAQGKLGAPASPQTTTGLSNTHELGMLLFSKYAWPFELASFLILMAVIAAIVIAKKDKLKTQQSS